MKTVRVVNFNTAVEMERYVALYAVKETIELFGIVVFEAIERGVDEHEIEGGARTTIKDLYFSRVVLVVSQVR